MSGTRVVRCEVKRNVAKKMTDITTRSKISRISVYLPN